MDRRENVDVLIIGAGPAGLAAAAASRHRGVDAIVLEQGASLHDRDRYNPVRIASGVGGAGLFSDGKFSFFPSATRLWTLQPPHQLREAYDWLAALLGRHRLRAPDFPVSGPGPSDARALRGTSCVSTKYYPSYYMPLDERFSLIGDLTRTARAVLRTGYNVDALDVNDRGATVQCASQVAAQPGRAAIIARALVVATGRLGPLFLKRTLASSHFIFRRLEIGVRLEQPAEKFFLRDAPALDPKLIVVNQEPDVEWRTFCCCRNGEVVLVRVEDIPSVSGRADVAPSGRSNIGFHVRVTDVLQATSAWDDLIPRLRKEASPITEPLDLFLRSAPPRRSPLHSLFGDRITGLLVTGIHSLMDQVGRESLASTVLYAPAVEAVPQHPKVDQELRLAGIPVWVAGDAAGLFRGLTASLVSGYFAGLRAATHLGAAR